MLTFKGRKNSHTFQIKQLILFVVGLNNKTKFKKKKKF